MALFQDVTCPLCGCLCDDLVIDVQGDQIVRTERACPVAQATFVKLNRSRPAVASLAGAACELEAAFSAAEKILRASHAPLIFGMASASTDDQRAAIRLTEFLYGVIDTAGAALTRAATLAMQQVGYSTCTLGEVKQRADLVIFWGADPVKTHPRHLERYSAAPASEFLPRGRADRTLVTIGYHETLTDCEADLVLRLPPGSDANAIQILRQLLRDEHWQPEREMGLPKEQLRNLAQRMKMCRYGVIFFGPELLTGPASQITIESLYRMVSELNVGSRFTVRALGNPGAENVCTWQTGFPLSIDFQQGFPRYQPGEFSARELLERKEVDSCIVIGSDCLSHLSAPALDAFGQLPTIFIDPPHLTSSIIPAVRFVTALPGVQAAGSMYRMDDVALPVRQLYESPYPTTETVLNRLQTRLQS